jgi:[ribosomal protein S18]-alanine N-acetyltransferase
MRRSEILVNTRAGFLTPFLPHWLAFASKCTKIKNNRMSPRILVRKIRLADLDRIQQIEDASFGEHAYERNLFAEFYDKCGDLFLAAERRSGICGYIITCIRGDRAELVSIAVDPASRAKGAGSALMASTLRRLRRRKVTRIGLMVKTTNAPARAFYENFGFHKVRIVRGYYEDGSDGVLMSRELEPLISP